MSSRPGLAPSLRRDMDNVVRPPQWAPSYWPGFRHGALAATAGWAIGQLLLWLAG